MPQRIQRKRTKGWRAPEDTIYVGRGSRWGNPWRVDDGMSARGAVWRYRDAVTGSLRGVWPAAPTIDQIRTELAGHDLMCWCPLDKPCHADILLELANGSDA